MKSLIFCFSFIIAYLFSSSATFANDVFVLKNKNLTNDQKIAVEVFIKKVSDITPIIIKENFKKPIEISFENLPESMTIRSLPQDKCNNSVNLIYGKSNSLNNNIVINQLLLAEILKGEEGSTSFNCNHKNYYRLAMATVLHEVSHLYDHAQFGATKVSGQKSFFKLSDWKKNILLIGSSKNLSQKRSVDPYEYKSLEEHYAVNFEYFILDPEYKCKRPTYYRYYATQFKFSPNADTVCTINTQIRLDDTKDVIDINPDRVYRVDYLLASKGDEMISGFGHSMYRLIVCAPFRKTVSADCIKDKLYHVVLSFRANITDIKSNPLKGLVGKYDSILFMLSFPKVIEEYNMAELRDLYSLPLNFTKEQKARFIHKALETYWEYSGSYKFITSNCASESNELLQSALNDHPIINESVVKPYSLMESIIKYNLSNKDYFKDLPVAKKNGLFFESDSKLLEKIKTQLFGDEESDYIANNQQFADQDETIVSTAKQKKKKHIKEIIQTIQANRFQEIFERLNGEEDTAQNKKQFDDLSIITQAALNVGQHNLDEEIGSYLEKLEKDPGTLGISIRNWNQKRKNFRLTPLKEDYGIPLEITDQDFEVYKQSSAVLEKTEMDLVNDVKDRYSEKVENLKVLEKVIAESREKSKMIGMKLYLGK